MNDKAELAKRLRDFGDHGLHPTMEHYQDCVAAADALDEAAALEDKCARLRADLATEIAGSTAAYEETLRVTADNARLRKRLEIDHAYRLKDGELVPFNLSPEEAMDFPDGIECREATIALMKEDIGKLRADNDRLREALENEWQSNHAEHCGRIPHRHDGDCQWPYPAILETQEAET